jgi:hypothetical protein
MTWAELKKKWQAEGRGLFLRTETKKIDTDVTRIARIDVSAPNEQSMCITVESTDAIDLVIVAACDLTDAELTILYP